MEQSMLARMERQIIMERHHLHLDQISNREPGYLKKPGTLMPASFDNAPPRRSRMKKRREGGGSLVQAYQRRKRIERQNVTLIKRLLNNKYRKTMYGVRKSLGPSSLNATERRTTLLQTVKENNILLKKIKTAPASINPSKWEKEHAQNLIKYKHMSKFHRYDEDVLGKIRRSRRNRRKEQISEKQQQTTSTTLKASPVNKMKKNKALQKAPKARKASKASNINRPKSPLTSRPKLKTKSPRVQRTTTHQSKSELHSKEMEGHIRAINTKNIKSNQKRGAEKVVVTKSLANTASTNKVKNTKNEVKQAEKLPPSPISPPNSPTENLKSTIQKSKEYYGIALRHLFQKYDYKKTGSIDSNGLKKLMIDCANNKIDLYPTNDELTIFIKFMDKDGDCSINENELVSFFQKSFLLSREKKTKFKNRSKMHYKIMTTVDSIRENISKYYDYFDVPES
jgi:hypothetical protein